MYTSRRYFEVVTKNVSENQLVTPRTYRIENTMANSSFIMLGVAYCLYDFLNLFSYFFLLEVHIFC
jgi:hypothetical protein